MRGWYDTKSGVACCSVGAAGFCGTYEEFLERCRRMDARRMDARLERRDEPGGDANGSPVEAL